MTYIDYGYEMDGFGEEAFGSVSGAYYDLGDRVEYSIAWSAIESAPGVFVDPWTGLSGLGSKSRAQKRVNLNIAVGICDAINTPDDLQGLAPDHPLFIERFKEMMAFALGQVEEGVLIDTVTLSDCGNRLGDLSEDESEDLFLHEVRSYVEEMSPMIHFMNPRTRISPKYTGFDSSVA